MKAKLLELLAKDKKRRAKEEKTGFSSPSIVGGAGSGGAGGFGAVGFSGFVSPSYGTWEVGTALTVDSANFITTSGSLFVNNANLTDYVFGEKEVLPIDVAMRRIEKYRKKHPEEFTRPLEQMYKKAYPKKKAGMFGLFKREERK